MEGLGALRSWFDEAERSVSMCWLGRRLRPEIEMQSSVVSIPNTGDDCCVLGHLLLEVDAGDLFFELGGVVPSLLGIEVELEDPHRPVRPPDGVVSGVPDHDLDGPVPEHVHLGQEGVIATQVRKSLWLMYSG